MLHTCPSIYYCTVVCASVPCCCNNQIFCFPSTGPYTGKQFSTDYPAAFVPVYTSLLILIRSNNRDFASDQNNPNLRHIFSDLSAQHKHCTAAHSYLLQIKKIIPLPLQAVRNLPSTSTLSNLTYHQFLKVTNEEERKKRKNVTEHLDLMFRQMLLHCDCEHKHCYIT